MQSTKSAHHHHDDPMPTKMRGLDASLKIHRIVDFFAAAQTLTTNSLYVPLATKFLDANEGIDAALGMLALSAGPCAGISSHFSGIEEFSAYQKKMQQRTYVSSWTRTRESVAMWALYSQDESSVQLSTTVGNLEEATRSYAAQNSNPIAKINAATEPGQFLQSSRIAAVQYNSIRELGMRIDRRRRAYDVVESRGLIKEYKNGILDRSDRDSARSDQYLFSTFELKDASFAHESEIRLILECVPYTIETLQIAARDIANMNERFPTNPSPKHDRGMLAYARTILREEGLKRGIQCADSMMLPMPKGSIFEVCIDPRCSAHKRRFMNHYFEQLGVKVIESDCFGYAGHSLSMRPRSRLLKI